MPWNAQAVQPNGRVDAALQSIASAIPAGRMSVSARQDRNRGELLPSWTMQITGPLAGSEFTIELAGPILGQLLEDAIEALVTLGIDVTSPTSPTSRRARRARRAPTQPDDKYVPVDTAVPDSYPA